MKKIFILFCIQSLFTSLLFAQPIIPVSNYHVKPDSLAMKYASNRLDRIVTCDSNGNVIKKIESYNFENNRLISCVETIADIVTKYSYGYDDCGNLTQYEVSKFSAENDAFLLKFKEERVYQNSIDCENSLLTYYFSEGVPESEAITVYRFEKSSYEYFPNGNIRKITKENESEIVIQEMSYTYDINGRVEIILSKNVENYQLMPTAKIAYTYFPFSENINHFETETIYRYDDDTEIICMKTIYDLSKYISEKLFISTVEYYDALGVSVINKEIRTSKYSENLERLQESEVKIYDENNSLVATIEYDTEGNVLQILKAVSDVSTQNPTWIGEWVYDNLLGVDTYYLKSNKTNNPLWYMSIYYDADIATEGPFPSMEKSEFMIYPNPVKDNLFVKCLSSEDITFMPIFYSVYSLIGKPLLHGTIHRQEEAIPVQSLPSGSYIIAFVAGEHKGTFVFVKN